jgi:peptidoglycan/LPS O-acetylase OafA/YrhL
LNENTWQLVQKACKFRESKRKPPKTIKIVKASFGNDKLLSMPKRSDSDRNSSKEGSTAEWTKWGMKIAAVATEAPGEANNPRQFRLGNRPALDGLRALAVIGVFATHLGTPKGGFGFLGVDLFFVLSGFLITCLLLEERNRYGSISVKAFVARRARRLLPGFFLFAISAFASVYFFIDDKRGRELLYGLGTSMFYFRNWYQIGSGEGVDGYSMPHLWSLAVEEQYYLIWPVAMAIVLPRVRGWALAAIVGVCAAASTLVSVLLANGDDAQPRIYLATDTRAAQLLVGALLAVLLCEALINFTLPARLDFVLIAFIAGFLLFGELVAGKSFMPLFYLRGGMTVVAVIVGLLLLALMQHPASEANRLLSLPPVRFLGKISYSFYLWHVLIQLLVGFPGTPLSYRLVPFDSSKITTIVTFVLTVACAWFSTHFVERRFYSWFLWANRNAHLHGAPGTTTATTTTTAGKF